MRSSGLKMSSQDDIQLEEKNPWVKYRNGEILINEELFNMGGIIAYQPNSIYSTNRPIGVNGFPIGAPSTNNKQKDSPESKQGRQLAFFQKSLENKKKENPLAKKQHELLSKLIRFQEPKIYIQEPKIYVLSKLDDNLAPYVGSYIFTKKPVELVHIKLDENKQASIEHLKLDDIALFTDIVKAIGVYDQTTPIHKLPNKHLQLEKLWALISQNVGHIYEPKNYIFYNLLNDKNLSQYIGSYIFTKKPSALFHIKLDENKQPIILDLKIEDTITFNSILKEIGNIGCDTPLQEIPNKQFQINKLWELISKNPGHKYEEPLGQASDDEAFIFNPERRDEIFIPHILDNKTGHFIHIFPSSKNTTVKEFRGFRRFYSCMCLLSTVQGKDSLDNIKNLIKHDIKFHSDQKITEIVYNPNELSPYEISAFFEFKKTIKFINKFSIPGERKELVFHVPSNDYYLFGFRLFLCGRISFSALDAFCKAIYNKTQEYIKKITHMCEKHAIHVTITSPFENIFGPCPSRLPRNFTKSMLEKLQLTTDEINPNINEEDRKKSEKNLVQLCLQMLKDNHKNEDQREVWDDFINVLGSDNIDTLEDLFKVANAVMVGVASKGNKDHTTCSILPVTEKQIIVFYDTFLKKSAEKCKQIEAKVKAIKTQLSKITAEDKNKKTEIGEGVIPSEIELKKTITDLEVLLQIEKKRFEKYPAIINTIALESVFAYDSLTNGPVFYSHTASSQPGSKLLTKTDILKYSKLNMTLFASGKPGIPLQEAINHKKRKNNSLSK